MGFSSDLVEPEPQDKFQDVPRPREESIQKLFDQAQAGRLESKKVVKSLTFGRGAPFTRYHQNLWVTRFEAHRRAIGQDIDQAFTGDDLIRFLTDVIKIMRLPAGQTGPMQGTITLGVRVLVAYSNFKWAEKDGFKMTKRDSERFETWLSGARAAGLIVGGRKYEQTSIGIRALSRMVTAYLQRAITQGTSNWDGIIAKVMYIVLVSSLGLRTGDISRSILYHGQEYMQWRHIDLYLDGDSASLGSLHAVVTVGYEKGKKTMQKVGRTIHLRPLDDPCQSHICPIALLLTHALRHSLVEGRDLQDVLDRAAARPDRRIIWTSPQWPIVVPSTWAGPLRLDRPAPPKTLLDALRDMALIAGMVDRPYMHALRRGAAQGVAHLPAASLDGGGFATEAVRRSLGHSHRAVGNGVTDSHVGDPTISLYNARVQDAANERIRGPRFAAQPTDVHATIYADITAEDMQLELAKASAAGEVNPKESTLRDRFHAARRRGLATSVEIAHETKGQRQAGLTAPPPMPPIKSPGAGAHQRPPYETSYTAEAPAADDSRPGPAGAPLPEWWSDNIDPALLSEEDLALVAQHVNVESLQKIENLVMSAASDDEMAEHLGSYRLHDLTMADGDAALEKAMTDPLAPEAFNLSDKGDSGQLITTITPVASPEDWIMAFARYNVVANAEFGHLWTVKMQGEQAPTGEDFDRIFGRVAVRGGTRDDPTPMLYKCSKTAGCPFVSYDRKRVREHEDDSCSQDRAELRAAAVKVAVESKGLRCPHGGCSYFVVGVGTKTPPQKLLSTHIREQHSFKPRPCESGCDPETLYATRASYYKHKKLAHSTRWPAQCTFPGCEETSKYSVMGTLTNHLVRAHGFAKDDVAGMEPYVPPLDPVRVWKPQRCTIDGCKSQKVFSEKKLLRQHLQKAHGMDKDTRERQIESSEHEMVTPKPTKRGRSNGLGRRNVAGEATAAASSTAERAATEVVRSPKKRKTTA